jgi:ribosome-associated protein
MEPQKIALLCQELADNRKAENIVILDVRKISSITDFFVIATGAGDPHVRAINDEITRKMHSDYGIKALGADGSFPTNWIALDYWDVIVHIMSSEARERYDIEALWGDAPRITQETPVPAAT